MNSTCKRRRGGGSFTTVPRLKDLNSKRKGVKRKLWFVFEVDLDQTVAPGRVQAFPIQVRWRFSTRLLSSFNLRLKEDHRKSINGQTAFILFPRLLILKLLLFVVPICFRCFLWVKRFKQKIFMIIFMDQLRNKTDLYGTGVWPLQKNFFPYFFEVKAYFFLVTIVKQYNMYMCVIERVINIVEKPSIYLSRICQFGNKIRKQQGTENIVLLNA